MSASPAAISTLQAKIWDGSLPLEIRLSPSDCRTYDESEAYLIQYPRLSYLSFLLPRLHAFFKASLIDPEASPHDAWLSFEDIPLKWHYPVGLLYDLLCGAELVSAEEVEALGRAKPIEKDGKEIEQLPFRLTVHYTEFPNDVLVQLDPEGRTMLDSYINSVKEADFIRNGNAKTIMSMSKEDSDSLWRSIVEHDMKLFNSINNKLLNPPGVQLRHVPLKIYLPSASNQAASDTAAESAPTAGHIRVVQSLVPLNLPSKQPQTLGTALNDTLRPLFPSRRNPLLATPVLHGAGVPMAANLAELGRAASYSDGFLHIAIVMLS